MKRSAPLRRHTPLAPVNRKRRQTEFQRTYHSRARVAFVRETPCIVCAAIPCDNAHIETDGMGRKADYDKIVPLCRAHHRLLHEKGASLFSRHYFTNLAAWAMTTERLWQAQTVAKKRRPAAAKTTKATKDTPAPRCEMCGRHEVKQFGLCTTCLTGKQGTHRRTA